MLITGANRGIGFEVTRQQAQRGHFVYLGSRGSGECVNLGHTAIAFNDYRSTKPVAQGAAVIVKYDLLCKDGVTRGYLSEEGERPL